jgi:[NiFe] hydrogenase diaphorase moiety small subunit
MSEQIRFTIDGKECMATTGQSIVEAAKENGVFIPVLCHYEGLKPAGTCRICTVNVNGRPMAACTTQVTDGMEVANDTPELREARKMMLEMLFVEGNHFCPACEKSGNCELQALAYRYQMLAPRFQFLFQQRQVDATHPKIILERNRCIMCKRCIRGIRAADGRAVFALSCRGGRAEIIVDDELATQMSDEEAQKAMDMCPVGAILRREKGFDTPIGKRKYDAQPIGSDIEGKA